MLVYSNRKFVTPETDSGLTDMQQDQITAGKGAYRLKIDLKKLSKLPADSTDDSNFVELKHL